jgi:hypothetical protein
VNHRQEAQVIRACTRRSGLFVVLVGDLLRLMWRALWDAFGPRPDQDLHGPREDGSGRTDHFREVSEVEGWALIKAGIANPELWESH